MNHPHCGNPARYGIARQVQIDAAMSVVVEPDESWKTHPQGGIVVFSPDRAPRWVRMVDGAFVAQYLQPDQPSA